MSKNKVSQGIISRAICACVIIALAIAVMLLRQHSFLSPETINSDNSEPSGPVQNIPSEIISPDPIPSPEPEISEPDLPDISLDNYDLDYELPINGASGFSLISMGLRETPDENSNAITTIQPGYAFKIISAQDNWWYVYYDGMSGWVDNTFCMINLPDIIPSIIYVNTNSTSSVLRSSGYDLPGITGERLYNARAFSHRFGEEQYIMPVLYQTAGRIHNAQQTALENGDSLKIYETFRPWDVQVNIRSTLQALMNDNAAVHNGINTGGWRMSWFISTSVSTHQMGAAVDASLVRIIDYEVRTTGGYAYKVITSYEDYPMPTTVHELSAQAVVLRHGVQWNRTTGWGNVPFADTMTEGAKALHYIFVNAGFIPLASEWWHFDDMDARNAIRGRGINGNFHIKNSASEEPNT